MIIESHTMVWNERDNLRIWCETNAEFADRLVIWDYGCTDGSIEMAKSYPRVEIRDGGYEDGLLIDDWTRWRNKCWRDSNADWVLITDADEWLWHPDTTLTQKYDCVSAVRQYLQVLLSKNYTIARATGFNLISLDPDLPVEKVSSPAWKPDNETIAKAEMLAPDLHVGLQLWLAAFHRLHSKPCLLRPKLIKELGITPGGHDFCGPGPEQILGRSELLLFNARRLGSIDNIWQRGVAIVNNRSPREMRRSPRVQSGNTGCPEHAAGLWRAMYANSIPCWLLLQVHRWYNEGQTVNEIVMKLEEIGVSIRPEGPFWTVARVQRLFGIPKNWWEG